MGFHQKRKDPRILKRDFKKHRDNVWDPAKERPQHQHNDNDGYSSFIKESAAFDAYYKVRAPLMHAWAHVRRVNPNCECTYTRPAAATAAAAAANER